MPGHFDREVYVALRRNERRGLLPRGRLDELVPLLVRFPAKRIPLHVLLVDAHRLGSAFSGDDAFYVALARRIGGQLRTRDEPLARACAGIIEVALV